MPFLLLGLVAALGLLYMSKARGASSSGDIRVPDADAPAPELELELPSSPPEAGPFTVIKGPPDQNAAADAPTAPVSGWRPPVAATPYLQAFALATASYGLPAGLLARMAQQESSFNALAVSKAGAKGLMQFMAATAADLSIDPFDAFESIDAAGKMMRRLYKRFGTWRLALAAYNWGEGHLSRDGIARAPDETLDYVARIAGDLGL